MATTATALFPGSSTFPNTTQYGGQGLYPIVRCRLSFDDASTSIPSWTEVASSKFRSYSVSRGRENELQQFDAGTATVVLDNRDRAYDPTVNSSIRPMNRVWLYEEFSGEVHDLFKGYAESWQQEWPNGGWSDAEVTLSASDEFKVLNLNALPVTSPPRDSYAEVLQFDEPTGYWPLNDDPNAKVGAGNPGTNLTASGTLSSATSLVVGANETSLTLPTTIQMTTGDLNDDDPGDPSGLAEFSVEFLLNAAALPTISADTLAAGPRNSGFAKWLFQLNTTGTISVTVRTAANAAVTVTAGTILPGTTYHVAGTISGGNLRLYLNGSQIGSTAWASTFTTSNDVGAGDMFIGDGSGEAAYTMAQLAFYRLGLSATRVAAHSTAALSRGFSTQANQERFTAVLDAVSSRAPRLTYGGAEAVAPIYMHGQPPLDELQAMRQSSVPATPPGYVDGAFLISASGTAVLFSNNHRQSSPFTTSQVTLGDAGGSEIPYVDLSVDYSESFLFNDWNVTRSSGTVQSASDSTSILAYGKRSQSISSDLITDDTSAGLIATALLAKYKDPMSRVTQVSLNASDPTTAEAAFRRELMDKITVNRTPPGGGARISQDLYIQKIEISGSNDGKAPVLRWGVSPL